MKLRMIAVCLVVMSSCAYADDIDDQMRMVVEAVKPTLPLQLDAVTTLTKMSYDNRVMTYGSVVTVNIATETDKELLKQTVTKQSCATDAVKTLLASGINVEYTYSDSKNKPIISVMITKDTCK